MGSDSDVDQVQHIRVDAALACDRVLPDPAPSERLVVLLLLPAGAGATPR